MKIDLANLGNRETHHLLVGAVVPRPIAWVSTVGEDGVFNLAPFSAYSLVSSKPAVVGFGVGRKRDGQKRTPSETLNPPKNSLLMWLTKP